MRKEGAIKQIVFMVLATAKKMDTGPIGYEKVVTLVKSHEIPFCSLEKCL